MSLGAYEIKIFKDIVTNKFGMPEAFGAITSICLNETQPILFSRTYTENVKREAWSVKGTYGQGVKASNISKFL